MKIIDQMTQAASDMPETITVAMVRRWRDGSCQFIENQWRDVLRLNPQLALSDLRLLLRQMRHAQIVWWQDDLRLAAIAGSELFLNKPVPEFNPPLQFWVFEHDIQVSDAVWRDHPQFQGVRYSTKMMLIGRSANRPWMMFSALCHAKDLAEQQQLVQQYGDDVTVPILLGGEPESPQQDMSFLTAMLEFMRLPIVQLETHQAPRAERRRAMKAGMEAPSDVSIVKLRRIERKETDVHQTIEWQHQWIVRGHWRNQYYPSTQEHKPVFVLPYLKGPDDKPLKENRSELIYAVTR